MTAALSSPAFVWLLSSAGRDRCSPAGQMRSVRGGTECVQPSLAASPTRVEIQGWWMKNSLQCPAKEADRVTGKWKIKTSENTYFKFKKRRDGTGDDDADLIKRQVFNCSNLVGNKRREIVWYLPATTKKKLAHMETLLNELRVLEHELRYKIEEFRAFMPGSPMNMPAHFLNLPALKKTKK